MTDPSEEAFLRLWITRQGYDSIWIGMNDRDADKTYEWADGWPVLYSRWGPGQPTALDGMGCVTMDKQGFWNDVFVSPDQLDRARSGN